MRICNHEYGRRGYTVLETGETLSLNQDDDKMLWMGKLIQRHNIQTMYHIIIATQTISPGKNTTFVVCLSSMFFSVEELWLVDSCSHIKLAWFHIKSHELKIQQFCQRYSTFYTMARCNFIPLNHNINAVIGMFI